MKQILTFHCSSWNPYPLKEEGFPGGSDSQESAAVQEAWVRALGQEDSQEKRMVTHSSILAWRIPWTEESGGLQSMGLPRVRHN